MLEETDDDDDGDEEEELGRPTKLMIRISPLTFTSACLNWLDGRVITAKIRSRHQ